MNESLNGLDLEDLDLEEDFNEADTKAPTIKAVVKDVKAVTITFIPDFDISVDNLDVKTMQVRKTLRTKEERLHLKGLIELQGQVEPIQVLKRGKKHYLIAGDGRVTALRSLDRTAKALVYENLTDDDALKISTGTNEGRIAMSEWDRINSIGRYFDLNPLISKDDVSEKNSLVSVFGFNKSTIYNYLKLWKFYKKKTAFHDIFKRTKCPLYVLNSTMRVMKDYEDKLESFTPVAKILKDNIHRNDLNKKTFDRILAKEITNIILSIRMNNQQTDVAVIDAPIDDPDIAKEERKVTKDVTDKILESEEDQINNKIGTNEDLKKLKADTEAQLVTLQEQLEKSIALIQEMSQNEFHDYIGISKINVVVKKIHKLNELVNVLL